MVVALVGGSPGTEQLCDQRRTLGAVVLVRSAVLDDRRRPAATRRVARQAGPGSAGLLVVDLAENFVRSLSRSCLPLHNHNCLPVTGSVPAETQTRQPLPPLDDTASITRLGHDRKVTGDHRRDQAACTSFPAAGNRG